MAVDRDGSVESSMQPDDRPENAGLARSVGPGDCNVFTRGHGEGDIVHRDHLPVPASQRLNNDSGAGDPVRGPTVGHGMDASGDSERTCHGVRQW